MRIVRKHIKQYMKTDRWIHEEREQLRSC